MNYASQLVSRDLENQAKAEWTSVGCMGISYNGCIAVAMKVISSTSSNTRTQSNLQSISSSRSHSRGCFTQLTGSENISLTHER
jgi:hypothetical protein